MSKSPDNFASPAASPEASSANAGTYDSTATRSDDEESRYSPEHENQRWEHPCDESQQSETQQLPVEDEDTALQ